MTTNQDAEGTHGHRFLSQLRGRAAEGAAEGAHLAGDVGAAAEALNLQIVKTGLDGPRALVGHVVGMRLLLPAEGVHGPRETAALLYLFADALAIRPTDDAPMSSVPLVGLHILMPHVAMAHWLYKAGRTAHANMDLERDEQRFTDSLAAWTVDDFGEADAKLDVHTTAGLASPVHLYEHLGFVRLALPGAGRKPLRLKSALPEPSATFVRMWELFDAVSWPGGLSMERPAGADEPRDPA